MCFKLLFIFKVLERLKRRHSQVQGRSFVPLKDACQCRRRSLCEDCVRFVQWRASAWSDRMTFCYFTSRSWCADFMLIFAFGSPGVQRPELQLFWDVHVFFPSFFSAGLGLYVLSAVCSVWAVWPHWRIWLTAIFHAIRRNLILTMIWSGGKIITALPKTMQPGLYFAKGKIVAV